MKVKIQIGERALTASLSKNKISQEFVSLLPLSLTMNDLFNREKYATLPKAISTDGEKLHTYEVGDIAYWSPTSDVAIFYKHDGEKIPDPGIIIIGKVDSGIEAFDVPGEVKVTIEEVQE